MCSRLLSLLQEPEVELRRLGLVFDHDVKEPLRHGQRS